MQNLSLGRVSKRYFFSCRMLGLTNPTGKKAEGM